MLDPAHPGTRQIVEKIHEIIERRSTYRTIIRMLASGEQLGSYRAYLRVYRGMRKTSAGAS